jgi:hypothetical protein
MHTARKDLAMQAFDRLGLTGRNRRLAIYWLSLWDGDRMPARAQFQPAAVRALLPSIGSPEFQRQSFRTLEIARVQDELMHYHSARWATEWIAFLVGAPTFYVLLRVADWWSRKFPRPQNSNDCLPQKERPRQR